MKLRECRLTTVDNPFDPFDDFLQWYMYDVEKGYDSSGYVGRIARTSNELTDQENNEEIERAIDDIIKLDFTNKYRKVVRITNDDNE